MTGSDRGLRLVEFLSRCVRAAWLGPIATAVLLTPATVEGQAVRLHTPSLASPTSVSFIVSFDAQGQPLPPTAGTFPANFVAQWQLPASPSPFGLRLSPSLRYAFVGAAADGLVALSVDARSALQAGGFLDASDNYVAGATRSPVLSATPTREGRYLLVLDSPSKNAIALLETGVEGGIPTVRSALVKTGASLPADTFGALGAGITIAPDLLRGTVVFGDATATSALLYSPGAAGNRFSSLDSIPNPPSFHYLAATSAGSDGAFWVVGVNGGNYEVRYLDAKTGSWDAPAATIPKATGDVLIPAFDPYDPGRMLLVVSKEGSTPTYVVTGLAKGVSKGVLTPTAQNTGFDFSASPSLQPVVLAPVGGSGRGYLLGRSTGQTSERLYAIDLTTGTMSSTPTVFGTARHQTLVLERPDQTLSIKADSTGAVSGGQTATFTVTRTNPSSDFVIRYTTQSADETAQAGRDYTAGPGTVTMASGSATAKISIPIIAVNGCAPQRTFSVKLTNTDAALTTSEAQQLIASSTNCTYGVVAPATALPPGQAMTFTATRSGTYLAGSVALPWTAAPGNSDTTTADFSPTASNVTLPSGAATAPIVVNTTPTTKDCVPEKAVTVTVTPQGGASASATGKIAAVLTGCTVAATVTAPEKPYLPGDEVAIVLSEVTPGRFDLSRATWTVTALGNTTYERLYPAGTQGRELKVRFWSATAADAAGSVKVDYSVPPLPGTPSPATGTLTLDRVAPYPDLVRMDGPGQYAIPAAAKKRYSLLWGGSTRKTTWLNPKLGSSDRKTVRWSYLRGGAQVVVNNCEMRAGEDCAFALPTTGDVTKVLAEASVGPDKWALIAEITPVKGVPAPATTAFEAIRYVPVALEFAGVAPAFFETELTLVNGTAGTVEAELKWGGLTQKEIVGAGRQFVINGLIEALRETNPSQAGAVGPLKVTFRGLASESDKRLVGVAARTTTPAGAQSIYRMSGRAGLAYRGVSRDELLGGEAGQSKAAWLIGLRGTTQSTAASVDRSNLAVAKPDPNDPDAVVSIELYGRTGTLLNTLADQTIKSWTQWSILAPTYANGTEVAYAKVVWKSGGPVTAYATPVNNKSGDGSWVFPVREEPAGAATTDSLVFPVLFEFPSWGAGNFRFLADAALAVPGTQTQTKLDYFWQAGAATGTTSLANSVKGQMILGSSIDPGVKSLGVVQSLRAGTGSVIPPQAQGQLVIGTALVSRADGQPFVPGTLMAGARVDGPSSEQDATAALYGRFGIYLPAVPMRDLKNLAELRVLGLRQDAWVRSNLALINPGNDPVALKLELQVTKGDGSAALVLPTVACGSSQVQNGLVTLPARTFCQIGSVLGAVGATSGYAILSRTGADAANPAKPFLAYGVVNDGPDATRGTSDGAYLLAELLPLSGVGAQVVDPPGTAGGALPAATLNAAYPRLEGTAAPAGRTYTFSATGLPAGMTLGQGGNKWFLTGSPTQTGTFSIVVRATDQAGATVSKTYTLSVSDCAFELIPPTLTTGKASNSSTFQVKTACSWTPRSAAASASWLTVTNPVKQTGNGTVSYSWTQNDGADREGKVEIVPDGATTAATSFILKQTVGCAYTLEVAPKTFCKAGGSGTVTVTPSAEACPWALTAPTWVSVPTETNTGTKTLTFTVTELAAYGQRDGDLRIKDAPYAESISQANPGPLTPSSNGPICAGNTLQLNVTGGLEGATYTWTGPNGFTSTQQNPSIPAATVAASGNYTVRQTVNGCDSATATLAVVVNPNPEITAFTAVPPSITKGQESTLTATFTNGTGVITPGNITVTSGAGVKVSPTAPTTYTLTVTSTTTPSCGVKTATVAVAVDCPAMTVIPASLSNGTAGVAYGPVNFGNTGGVGTVNYTVSLGALPAGITLTLPGVLSGTPTVAGTFNFTVTATDSNGCSGTRAFTLVINKGTATVTIASDTPDPSVVGQAVAVVFTVTGSGANPTGNVTVSAPNTTGNCTATVAAGTCNLTFTTAGIKAITATYDGDGVYGNAVSSPAAHTVASTLFLGVAAYFKEDAPDSHPDEVAGIQGEVVQGPVTHTTSGKIGGASVFAGYESSQSPRVRASIPGVSTWSSATVSLWVNLSSVYASGNLETVFQFSQSTTWGHRWGAIDPTTKRLVFHVGTGATSVDAISATEFQPGYWYHVVATWNKAANRTELYVNGILEAQMTVSSWGEIAEDLYLGAGINGYGVSGTLDEIGIWGRVLTASEVGLLFNSGGARSYPFN